MSKLLVIIVLVICTACQTGLIPCPTIKPDKVRRHSSFLKKMKLRDRTTMASARDVNPSSKQIKQSFTRLEPKPPLENVDVEEWDCPKPGTKKTLPKALKDNIRKNMKAYESYYRHRADSVQSFRHNSAH